MKKSLLTIFLISAGLILNAQQAKPSLSPSLELDNELKLNILYLLVGAPEITYERILNKKNAVGVATFIRFSDAVWSDYIYAITPYYRRYFGFHKASGFFLEGHVALANFGDIAYRYPNGQQANSSMEDRMRFGVGGVAGAKFLTRKGFTGEIYFGGAQLLDNYASNFFPRAGLILGKRF